MSFYLVTGGAGFIGSNIVERLVARGERVRVLDDFSSGKRENLAAVVDRVELLQGTICDAALVRYALRDADYVLHLAARPSVIESIERPDLCHAGNVTGTFNVLMAAREAGVKRLVFSASAAAYGNSAPLPNREDAAPDPLSPYAVAKVTGEYYCKTFAELYSLPTVALRYFNVFGPRQNPHSQYASVIPKFITMMLRGEPPTIFGDGEQTRDFVHVENVFRANLLACQAPGVEGRLFNIAAGRAVSVNELAATIGRILGKPIAPVHAAERPGEVRHSTADIARARQLLGYEPSVGFEDGLRQTVEWYRGNAECGMKNNP
jgi:UDP-glucose 4-epimerase